MYNDIIEWGHKHNLINDGDEFKQLAKVVEELGELARSTIRKDTFEQIDSIGDIQIALIILTEILNLDYDKCREDAFRTIKFRSSKRVTYSKEG